MTLTRRDVAAMYAVSDEYDRCIWKGQLPGGVDLCPLCWPLDAAEKRFQKKREA